MNIKQFLFITITCASLTASIFATEDSAVSQQGDETTIATQSSSTVDNNLPKFSREQEIAFEIENKTLVPSDKVTYDGKEYTLTDFSITTNESVSDYYRISYDLEKEVTWLGMNVGKDKVSVTIQDGQQPEYPHNKIKNPDAVNDTRYSVDVHRYFNANRLGEYLLRAAEFGTLCLGVGALLGATSLVLLAGSKALKNKKII